MRTPQCQETPNEVRFDMDKQSASSQKDPSDIYAAPLDVHVHSFPVAGL